MTRTPALRATRAGLAALAALAALATIASCGSPAPARRPAPPPHPDTLDDPRAAVPPPEIASVPTSDPARGAGAGPRPGAPTFARDVAPLVHRACGPCHHPGGGAPFSLLTYRDVEGRKGQVALVTRNRYMPPWQPAHGYVAFEGERRLADAEIALIQRWVEAGAPEGDPAATPPPPAFPSGWRLGTPDLVVRFPYDVTLRADGPDVFRNFVIPDVVDGTRYVRGFEFLPGGARVVHHAEFRVDETDRSLARDREDPGPGYDGMDADTAHYPEGHFLSWVPGKTPRFEPDTRAWELARGTDLVVQFHMLPSGKAETFRPQVGLYFAPRPPTEVVPVNLRLGSKSMDIPAGETRYVVRDTYTLPVEVDLLSVMPHAHYICRDMKAWAVLPDGSRRWLVRIPDWDFNWQDEYRFVAPPRLPAGTVLAMEYVFDNSAANERNPHQPPRRIVFGPNSANEMADLWVRVRPRGALERAALKASQGRHRALEDAAHLEDAIARGDEPQGELLKQLSVTYQRAGWQERREDALRRALEADGDDAAAHELLAVALFERGDRPAALAAVERAAALNPASATTQYNLGVMLAAEARLREAADAFRRALELDPKESRARAELERVARTLGQSP